MQSFELNLLNALAPKPETVKIDRITNFYKYIKDNNYTGSICWYENEFLAIISTDNKTLEGHGRNINDALNDILKGPN